MSNRYPYLIVDNRKEIIRFKGTLRVVYQNWACLKASLSAKSLMVISPTLHINEN